VRFLADESCDVAVVTALRNAGHDVKAIAETNPGAEDEPVLALASSEARVLLTEDKDFGLLAYPRPSATPKGPGSAAAMWPSRG
jgi:predicted nuclease of predicted toxin-antitoxin system